MTSTILPSVPLEAGEVTPGALRFLSGARLSLLIALSVFVLHWITVGTPESRILYLVSFLLGFANPAWGLLAFTMIAPLMLQDVGKVHILMGSEILMLGIFAGALRQWRPGRVSRSAIVHWGVWPHYLIGFFLLLLASALVGLQLVWLREEFIDGISGFHHRWIVFWVGSAAEPEWALRSLWNWTTGMVLAVVAARLMDETLTARWLKMGAICMAIACMLGLLEWAAQRFPGWTEFSLNHIRRLNPDPLQAGRLQGTGGHPGWFAQWIILMWPGLLLWWSPGRSKRNAVILLGVAICGLALVLSAARAAWLGMLVAGAVGTLVLVRHYPEARKRLPWVLLGGAGILLVALLIGGNYLWFRLEHLLRAEDRANYYVSGLIFLREFPFGLGLGTHFRFYGAMIPPNFRWGQSDYVDSHNLLLHTLIENGPFVPLMIVAGALGLAVEVRKSWARLSLHEKEIIGSLILALVGAAVVSVAQYIVYIRVVEMSLWIMAGALVGLCRKRRATAAEAAESPRGRRLLLICGVAAVLMASMNAGRTYAGSVPRNRETDSEDRLAVWTGTRWRMVVENDVDRIEFDLYRRGLVADVSITWPDGRVEHVKLVPEPISAPLHERQVGRHFTFTRTAGTSRWFDKPGWLEIDVTPLWTPANIMPDATDTRGLGVYISGLVLDSPRLRSLADEQSHTESETSSSVASPSD